MLSLSQICQVSEVTPERVALLGVGRDAFSYGDLAQVLHELPRWLLANGVSAGERVAVSIEDRFVCAQVLLGVMAGFASVPLNPDYTEAELLRYLEKLSVEALLVDDQFPDSHRTLCERLGIRLLRVAHEAGRIVLAESEAGTFAPAVEDVALILLTSGSTSEPKAVPLTHRNLDTAVEHLIDSLDLGESDVCLNVMPLFHIGGLVDLLLAPLSCGGSVIVADDASAITFYQAATCFRPTWYQGPPAMLKEVLAGKPKGVDFTGLECLRFMRSVSSPLAPELYDSLTANFALPIIEIYGMTETCGVIASNPLGGARLGSVGKVVSGELRILDSAGLQCPLGQSGRIVVRGDAMFSGYLNDGRGADLFENGWFTTGDLGYLDAEGYLYLTGRLKDIINRGGEKIAPVEVDHLVDAIEGVLESAAFALPHRSLGEDIALAVVRCDGASLDDAMIRALLKGKLAPFKIPRRIYFLDTLPRNEGGKLLRNRLPDLVEGIVKSQMAVEVRAATKYREPLSVIWKRLLLIDRVDPNDDFFDLGGDSLSVVSMMASIERTFRLKPDHLVFYQGARLVDLETYLVRLEAGEAIELSGAEAFAHAMYQVQSYLRAWEAEWRSEDGLLTARHLQGTRQPLFWSCNTASEFNIAAAAVGQDQPIYGMRTLMGVVEEEQRDYAALSDLYVQSIRRVQPKGPYLLGGFCEGAHTMHRVAERLRELGEVVALLFSHDYEIQASYTGRIAFLYSDASRKSPYYRYRQPELGWNRLFPDGWAMAHWSGKHTDASPELIATLGRFLNQQIKDALLSSDVGSPNLNVTPPLTSEGFRSKLELEAPAFTLGNSACRVRVRVTNCSELTWPGGSLISVMARWRDGQGKVKAKVAGAAPLVEPLVPGASEVFEFAVEPSRRLRLLALEVDLVEDGVCWFSEKGAQPASQNVFII